VCEQEPITPFSNQSSALVRHYSEDEQERLGVDGLALITRLVNTGVLDLNS